MSNRPIAPIDSFSMLYTYLTHDCLKARLSHNEHTLAIVHVNTAYNRLFHDFITTITFAAAFNFFYLTSSTTLTGALFLCLIIFFTKLCASLLIFFGSHYFAFQSMKADASTYDGFVKPLLYDRSITEYLRPSFVITQSLVANRRRDFDAVLSKLD